MQRGLWLPLLFLALGLAAIGGFAGAAWALTDGGVDGEPGGVEVRAPEEERQTPPEPSAPGQRLPAGSEPGFLGVVLGEAPDEEGALVLRVAADSPAERAGIEVDDVIVAVEGEPVDDPDDVVDIVTDAGPGAELTVTVMRNGDERDLQVVLGERPPGLGEVLPRGRMPVEPPGPPERILPGVPQRLLPELRRFLVPPLDRLFEEPERFLERFVRAEVAFLNDEGEIETVRAVAGTVEEIDGDGLVLTPKEGRPNERFAVSDETHVWRFSQPPEPEGDTWVWWSLEPLELDDIEQGDSAVVVARDGDEAVLIVVVEEEGSGQPS